MSTATATRTVRLTPADPEWPTPLNDLGAAAPRELHARGHIDTLAQWADAICLTGSRAATAYGEHASAELASHLADHDIPIITAGSYGIDAAAIRAHLDSPQIVFFAGGLHRAYPAGHAALFDAVVARGGIIVTAHQDGIAPTRERFLERQQYLATARATVIIEAASRSGALNVAHTAQALGRPVGAVPGPITSASSVGCHTLIRDHGAQLIAHPADLDRLTN